MQLANPFGSLDNLYSLERIQLFVSKEDNENFAALIKERKTIERYFTLPSYGAQIRSYIVKRLSIWKT